MSDKYEIRSKQSSFPKTVSLLGLITSTLCFSTVYALGTFAHGRDLTFIHTSDLHYDVVDYLPFSPNSYNVQALNTLGGASAEFVMVSGDLTDDGESWQWNLFDSDYPQHGGTGSGVVHYPVYAGAGNHDRVGVSGSSDAALDEVIERYGGEAFSWDADGVHFVNLDLYPGYSLCNWLEDDLDGYSRNTPVVIMTHYGYDEWNQDWWGEYWETRSENFKDVIGNYNVIGLVHGHGHDPYHYRWEGYDVFEGGSTKEGSENSYVGVFEITDNTLTWSRYNWDVDLFSLDINLVDVDVKYYNKRYFNGASNNVWDDSTTMSWGHSTGYYNSVWFDGCDADFVGTSTTVSVGAIASVNSMTFDGSGYILTGGTINMTGAGGNITTTTVWTTTINSSISGSVGLTKNGPGRLVLNGTNTYSGTTTINDGILLVNGSLSNSGVTVSKGLLGGTGVISGAVGVESDSILSPGAYTGARGTLTVNNSLTLDDESETIMDLHKSGATLTNDLITGVTTLTYGGCLTIGESGDAFADGDTWDLFNASSFVGAFDDYDLPELTGNLVWDTSMLAVNGEISVLAFEAVPEPSMAALLAGLIIACGIFTKKRRKV